jgi:hypothetical protein
MTYFAKFHIDLLIAGMIAVVGAVKLAPFGLVVNILFAIGSAYLAIVICGGCLDGRICRIGAELHLARSRGREEKKDVVT